MYVVELRINKFKQFVRVHACSRWISIRSRRKNSSVKEGYSVNRLTQIDPFWFNGFKESINRFILLNDHIRSRKPRFFSQNLLQNTFLAKCPSRKISSFLKNLSKKFLFVKAFNCCTFGGWVGDRAVVLDVL